jgi:cytochrome P450
LLIQTVATIHAFFVAMQLYPDIQSRAREEVLSTVDPITHLPETAAVMKLDYLRRVLKEVLRWSPALPIGEFNLACKMTFEITTAEQESHMP